MSTSNDRRGGTEARGNMNTSTTNGGARDDTGGDGKWLTHFRYERRLTGPCPR